MANAARPLRQVGSTIERRAESRSRPQPRPRSPLPTPLAADTIARFGDDPDFVTALARGLAVLLALSDKRRRMSIAQVSHRTGIPRAAARRSLHTLAKLGFVAVDDARRFYLRPRVLSFSHAYLSASPIAVLAQPILDRLGECAARGLLARDARRRRDRLPRALDVVADHVAVAQRRPPPAGLLHVDRPRDARAPAAGRARRVPRAGRASTRTPSTRRTRPRSCVALLRAVRESGYRVREPADGAAPVHARGAGPRRRRPLRRRASTSSCRDGSSRATRWPSASTSRCRTRRWSSGSLLLP